MTRLLQLVRLTRDIPEDGLRKGMVGTIIEVFDAPSRAYEVEFVDDEGRTVAQVTLTDHEFELAK